ncbi:MAG: hypothetical protein K8T10_19035 [Candidatus Eremiobacteraeota bacterium]|nr:hypothetical protein [Candidatus Eremiobacteraeota bacterium]
MHIDIYPLIIKRPGKVSGEEFLAKVELAGLNVIIECYDLLLKEKLKDIFSQPIVIRTPFAEKSGVLSHHEEVVRPFTEEFFREIVFILYKYGLYGISNE